ncbi:MAG: transketolase [Eubacteriaceae bacterium]|nr:transketolase [Eubacteriaceae bacterium]
MMDDLRQIAKQARIDILNQVYSAASGHLGGAFSSVEILVALYFSVMDIPSFEEADRDRFVLSKGHASSLLYSVLSQKGAFDRGELANFRRLGSILQGHPVYGKAPGIEMSTGSLGMGVSAATGIALAGKMDKKSYRVYTLLGDGEMQEGLVWEALMAISHFGLANMTVIIDNNGLQIDGPIQDVMNPYPIDEKLEAFGFHTQTVDGHDFGALIGSFDAAKVQTGKPSAIIAKTVKGKGVSFMEGNPGWHGKAPNEEEYEKALLELGGK